LTTENMLQTAEGSKSSRPAQGLVLSRP
jgi:hypothetical protein